MTQRGPWIRFRSMPVHTAFTQKLIRESLWPNERIRGKARPLAKRRPLSA